MLDEGFFKSILIWFSYNQSDSLHNGVGHIPVNGYSRRIGDDQRKISTFSDLELRTAAAIRNRLHETYAVSIIPQADRNACIARSPRCIEGNNLSLCRDIEL